MFGAVMTVALAGGAAGPVVGGWAATSSPAGVLLVPLIGGVAIAILTLIVSGWKPGNERLPVDRRDVL